MSQSQVRWCIGCISPTFSGIRKHVQRRNMWKFNINEGVMQEKKKNYSSKDLSDRLANEEKNPHSNTLSSVVSNCQHTDNLWC